MTSRLIGLFVKGLLIAFLLSGNDDAELFAVAMIVVGNLLALVAGFAAFEKFKENSRQPSKHLFYTLPVQFALIGALIVSGHPLVGAWSFVMTLIFFAVRYSKAGEAA